MPSSNVLAYNQTPPRRPTVDDLGGAGKVNGLPEPDPVRHQRAEDVNQNNQAVAALARVSPIALVQVAFDSGATDYDAVVVSSTIDGLVPSDFHVVRNGPGDVTVSWPTTRFPASVANPRAHPVGATVVFAVAQPGTSGSSTTARVRMQNAAGAATDSSFDLDIF